MTTYTPDCWVVLAIKQPLAKCATVEDSILHKIFATWRGGYLDSPAWKLNSGNEKVVKDIARGYECYHVHGFSGSIYELHKDGYGLSGYSSSVLQKFLEEDGVELLSEEESLEYLEKMSHERNQP